MTYEFKDTIKVAEEGDEQVNEIVITYGDTPIENLLVEVILELEKMKEE